MWGVAFGAVSRIARAVGLRVKGLAVEYRLGLYQATFSVLDHHIGISLPIGLPYWPYPWTYCYHLSELRAALKEV